MEITITVARYEKMSKKLNLEHRLSLARFKFHNLHQVLTNQRIPCALRLRLFDAVVSPTAVYSLNTTPLTASQMAKLDATQRRMMRRIVGWTRYDDEAWEETGKRMKRKLEVALSARPVLAWSEARNKNRARMSSRISEGTAPALVQLAHAWQPAYTDNRCQDESQAHRARGRPRQRWT